MNNDIKLIIACEVFKNELESLKSEISVPIIWIEHSLHSVPNKLRRKIQEEINKAEKEMEPGSKVLLMFGNCGGALNELHTNMLHLIYPEVPDCTPILLGSMGKYTELQNHRPGTYYFNNSWIESGNNPLDKNREYALKYGEELAWELSNEIYKNYTHFTLINNGCYNIEKSREFVKESCRQFNKEYSEEMGSLEFIADILNNRCRMVHILPDSEKEENEFEKEVNVTEINSKKHSEGLLLGVDTGGTYTDGVILDLNTKSVVSTYKSITTHYDLTVGIKRVIENIVKNVNTREIRMVSISTTLATNMMVEGKGGRVALILVGYDREIIKKYNFYKDFSTDIYGFFTGGHDVKGKEKAEVDIEEIKEFVNKYKNKVDAFALSSYFSVYNPSHEQLIKKSIKEITDKPVVCGHELSGQLNAVKRAATTVINAKLIPAINRLIEDIKSVMREKEITAPLYIVKGDGSIVSAEVAKEKPIETILSGPAASAIGARALTEKDDCVIVDMGGTTTDVGLYKQGKLKLNPSGIKVDQIYTHVQAMDMVTAGIGGDSSIHFGINRITVGPKRIMPLCRLAYKFPCVKEIIEAFSSMYVSPDQIHDYIDFVYIERIGIKYTSEDPLEMEIINAIKEAPLNIQSLASKLNTTIVKLRKKIENLYNKGIIEYAGFTPTDIAHCEDFLKKWDIDTSKKALKFICFNSSSDKEKLITKIKKEINKKILSCIFDVLGEEYINNWNLEGIVSSIVHHKKDALLKLNPELSIPIIAVGAPAEFYIKEIENYIKTDVIIPTNYDVANAVGAVSANISLRLKGKVECDNKLAENQIFRVYSYLGIKEFASKQDAYDFFINTGKDKLTAEAKIAGADDIIINEWKEEQDEDRYFYQMDIELIAFGRPILSNA